MATTSARSSFDNYPRPHRRGPIEANQPIRQVIEPGHYPRPHRRGPIEAERILGQSQKIVTIRVLTGAAPLKQLCHDARHQHDHGAIRVLTGAAPLKPRTLRRLDCLGPRYPRPHRRGPIEATAQRVPRYTLVAIRVLTGAAPLKPQRTHTTPFPSWPIRVLTGTAPLKQARRHGRTGICPAIRVLTGAAPLKHSGVAREPL